MTISDYDFADQLTWSEDIKDKYQNDSNKPNQKGCQDSPAGAVRADLRRKLRSGYPGSSKFT
jgi:hypothetical protein